MTTLKKQPLCVALGMSGFLFSAAAVSAQTPENNPAAPASSTTEAPGATSAPGPTPVTTTTVTPATNMSASDSDPDANEAPKRGGLLLDIKDYYTAPLRWDVRDWAYFAGAVGLTAAAHHYDSQVRTHFISQGAKPIGGSTKDLQDAAPAVAAVVGTWFYAGLLGSEAGHQEAWEMVEAGGLATVTSYALKFAVGRERPDQTSDPNKWRHGGSSFPSFHTAAAFAIGGVLAESGNDDDRWLRRFLGYGVIGAFTAFERVKHNAHWLSDDFAGAAIGGATARFILERNKPHIDAENGSALSVVPIPGGAMLTYNVEIK